MAKKESPKWSYRVRCKACRGEPYDASDPLERKRAGTEFSRGIVVCGRCEAKHSVIDGPKGSYRLLLRKPN